MRYERNQYLLNFPLLIVQKKERWTSMKSNRFSEQLLKWQYIKICLRQYKQYLYDKS